MRTRRSVLTVAVSLALASSFAACKRDGGSTRSAERGSKGPKPTDPEKVVPLIVESMQKGDRKMLIEACAAPLDHDLSQAAFDDFALVIQYLGSMKDFYEQENSDSLVAKQRRYTLEFEKGEIELMVQLYPDGGLAGFHFDGDEFIAAEHGALADGYSTFKVYDFAFIDGRGRELPGSKVKHGEIRYQIVVGGLEAKQGEHHLSIEKIVLTDDKKEAYHKPEEFDLKFEENAEGIPRGVFRGMIEITHKGHYDLILKIKDNISKREIEYHHDLEVH